MTIRYPWRLLAQERDTYIATRSANPLPDQAFFEQLGLRDEPLPLRIATCVRQVISAHCGLPRELLYASDPTLLLEKLMGGETLFDWLFDMHFRMYDYERFATDLERSLFNEYGISIIIDYQCVPSILSFSSRSYVPRPSSFTLKQWTLEIIVELESLPAYRLHV